MLTKTILPLLLLLVTTNGCNSVEPPPDGNGVDTTSHNFTFQKWTFGTLGGSTLYDCAVISPENIWCVGEIMIADTSINGYTTYNAVHWDGNEWELKRINVNFRGNIITPPLEGAFAFSNTDIWFVGSLPIQGDGENWIMYDLRTTVDPNISVSKSWGLSSNDIYFVGRNGSITRYYNGTWSKIASGTTLNINDIWGIVDGNDNKFILSPAYDFGSGGKKKLISLSNNTVGEIPWMDNKELYTVWFNSRDKIYAGGEGLFYRSNNEWKEETLPALFKFRVRGNGLNDIWTVGGYGFAAHYNGKSWKTFEEVSLTAGNYLGLAVKGNTVIMTGNEGTRAVITIGRRQ